MENCPYHNIEPTVTESVVREKISETYSDRKGRQRMYELPELTMYKVYCPLCLDESDASGKKTRRFGTGYAYSDKDRAISRWDSECMTEHFRLFKKAITTGNTDAAI